jgi:hypothetical protein
LHMQVKILGVNNSERNERRENGLADTSDDGQYMNFRNETLDGKPFFWGGVYVAPTLSPQVELSEFCSLY